MAGNRLHWTGSIFQRLSGLLKSEAVKYQDRPLWYDIYKAFPPKHEPTFARPAVHKEILPILYPEDVVRGKFAKLYGSPGYHDFRNPKAKSVSQRFLEKYQELEKTGQFSNKDDLFDATEDYFINEGLFESRDVKNVSEIDQPIHSKEELNIGVSKPL